MCRRDQAGRAPPGMGGRYLAWRAGRARPAPAARSSLIEASARPLEADEDRVWRAVLRLYAERERPPWRHRRHDGRRRGSCASPPGKLAAAGPDRPGARDDGHPVRGPVLTRRDRPPRLARWAVPRCPLRRRCARSGSLEGADIEIESLCRPCGEPLRVATADESRDVRSATPGGVVVQYAFDDEGSAATSYCQSTAFCTGELLRRWLDGQAASRDGLALSLDEALEVGRAVFGPRPGALDASEGSVARPSEVVRRAPGKGRRRASGACSLLSRRREKVPPNSVLHRPLGLLDGPGHRDRLALRSGTPAWLLGNRIGDKGCPRFRSNVRSGSGTQLAHLLIPKPG